MDKKYSAQDLRSKIQKIKQIKAKFFKITENMKSIEWYYKEIIDYPLEWRDETFIATLQEFKDEIIFENYKNINEITNYFHNDLIKYKNWAFYSHKLQLDMSNLIHQEILIKIVINKLPNFKTLKICNISEWENTLIDKLLSAFPLEVKNFLFNK